MNTDPNDPRFTGCVGATVLFALFLLGVLIVMLVAKGI